MPKKSAAHQKKVNAAMRILETTTGLKVPQAMILAGFSKGDIADEIVHRMIRRRLQAKQVTHRCALTIRVIEAVANSSDVSPLTGDDEHQSASTRALTAASSTGPTHPKPKQK